MSTAEENTSSTCVETGSTALSPPGSGDPVDEREPALQPPSRTETTFDGGGGKRVTVTLEEPARGKRKLSAWCWRVVSRFTPSINDKNVVCLVKRGDGSSCNHLMKWTPSKDGKKGTGTSGLISHIEKKHPDKYKEIMEEVSTSEERKAPVAAAIGEELA